MNENPKGKEFRADLHCHTTCSDGSLSPTELVKLAKEVGLSGLAITDHDSISAYSSAIPVAREMGLELISGIEFSAHYKDVSVHILGYSFAENDVNIFDLCQRHCVRRESRNRAILDKLKVNNMPISMEEVQACVFHPDSTIGRPHIALAMVKKGYVSSVLDAFKKYLGEERSCYVRGLNISVEETVEIIHRAKGLAVIAHPHLIKHPHLVEQMLKMNFDGLEGYYANFFPAQNDRWIKLAQKKGWIITGGSDFHGDIKPNISLGASWVSEDVFRILQKHYANNKNSN